MPLADTTFPRKNSLIFSASLDRSGRTTGSTSLARLSGAHTDDRQIRQGIASNSKGTAYVVYDDVMDAKVACDKLNGFNFQNRYLVGESRFDWHLARTC